MSNRTELRGPSVRASVERGDPWAIFRNVNPLYLLASLPDCPADSSLSATATDCPEADPPQPVTADPEILDTQLHGNYGDAMTPHSVEFDSALGLERSCSAGGTGERRAWSEESRLAFLARAQRLDVP